MSMPSAEVREVKVRAHRVDASSRRLHLGCGTTSPDGWVNVDGSFQVVLAKRPLLKWAFERLGLLSVEQARIPWKANVLRADLARPLPFPSRSFDAVYSSHTLEHLHRDDALALLRECHRVLVAGGVCRIVVPDLAAIVDRYLRAPMSDRGVRADELMRALRQHETSRARGAVGWYRRLTGFHQHKWMYDAASLASLFEEAGFPHPTRASAFESAIDGIEQVEHRGRVDGGEGVVVEARKERE